MDRKRVFDLFLTLPIFVVSLPVQGVVALLIHRHMGSPTLFRQERPGQHGAPFEMIDFAPWLLPDRERGLVGDADRMTRLGRVLRATSLDELPPLWNTIRGDMSLVGPRTLLVRYLTLYSAEQTRRHEVRPGITGLAQISGRNALSWERRFALDVEYVDHHSLRGDVVILMATVGKVLRRDGISADDSVTMPKFTGSPAEVGRRQ